MNDLIKHTSDFLHQLRSKGRYAFTLEDLSNEIPKSVKNIRKDIDRLRDKGDIISIRRGFYTIVPDEYKNMGVIPVDFYIDELMKFITKKYYVALFSAAMFHGAAHQQPQEFFVVSQSPKPRKIKNDNSLINFSEKKNFPIFGIEDKKTETGFFKISNKELTFLDLIYFEHTMGGYNRIMTILQELAEDINVYKMKDVLKNDFPLAVIQRAGYIAENILFNNKLANIYENKLAKLKPKTVLLKSSANKIGDKDEKWKLLINTKIESDI
ncbi:MAG: type IV toxin-antitoxin system AbiEi family antitoxin domain-containing protein [Bacteroidales bacterium]